MKIKENINILSPWYVDEIMQFGFVRDILSL